jgi:hypothetical protein
LQHDNSIEAAQSRQAVGDGNDRSSAHQALKRIVGSSPPTRYRGPR